MKFSLDGLKKANWKQFAVDHGEKVGLIVAVLVAGVLLFSGMKGTYTAKNPTNMLAEVDQQERALKQSVWTAERRAEDLPDFDVRKEANRVMEKLEPDAIMWPKPIDNPIYPTDAPGGEPTWQPVESLIADYVALPVRLTDKNTALGTDEIDPEDPDAEDPDEPGDFDIFTGGGGGGQGMFDLGGSSPFEDGNTSPFDGGNTPNFGSEDGRGMSGEFDGSSPFNTPMGGGYGEESGFGAPVAESNARGKGVKMIAIRGVFPFRRQVQELASSLNISFSEAKAQLEFLDMEIERQRAAPGPNPWTEDWEPVDREAAEALLADDYFGSTGQSIEVVSPALTDPSITMPLPTLGYGNWMNRAVATHPRIKEFDISSESPELRERILEMLREEAAVEEEQNAAAGPQRRTFGPDRAAQRGFGYDARAAAQRVIDAADAEDGEDDPVVARIRKMTADEVLLLARFFDVAVEPGQAYRYRMRLKVVNPNFGLGPADVSDPAALVGETRMTPWSDPSPVASVPPDEYTYLTSMVSKPSDQLPEARLEVTEYSREYGTLVAQDTKVIAGDLLVFEERNTYTLDPFKMEKDEKADYPFITDHVVIGVDALPDGAAALHPDLNLGNRKLPPGRVLLLLDTGAVQEIDSGQELLRRSVASSVQKERDGLGPQLTDVNAPKVDPNEYGEFGEFGEFGEGGSPFGFGNTRN
ncbi:hypothetical protein [Alienimonas chondri]|uniref:Uncharacterized protein n=1 Tax=Alienimonas chondri TaxID=2681879 RepID=A0ABX1VI27_9PLAN|nr:hypothetical protein [Alienimonas chondri]NNJ27762.1 hypothetical protein [Alienimonas chondri]